MNTVFVINNDPSKKCLGELSIIQRLNESGNLVIEGIMELDQYYDDINSLLTRHYKLEGVQITSESFATKEKKVQYTFTATSLIVNTEILNNDLIAEEGDDE